jgi:hypothetical protein
MAAHTLNGTSGVHQWFERREPHLRIESGEAVVQHHCWRCRRNLVTVLTSGRRHAVEVSILYFFRLDDEVTERWLNEPCPGARLASDDEDRKKRLGRKGTARRLTYRISPKS